MDQLCAQDRAILNSLFNPLLPIGEGVDSDTGAAEQHTVLESESDDGSCPEARQLNVAAVRACEDGRTQEALDTFAQAIKLAPTWAAPYNNRAQLYRLLRKEDEAVSDLEKALQLCGGRGAVGRQALVQRGLLHRLKGEEDPARETFKRAAELGSSFAKTQMVALNPMAALCNKMLVKMVADVRNGINTDEN